MLMNRRLYRSRTDAIIGGVAAGVANYLNTDSALVAYIVAWIVVPEEARLAEDPLDPGAGQTLTTSEPARDDGRTGMVVGIGLVLIGLWFLLREYLPDIEWGLVWPFVVIGAGVLILATSMRRRR